jgi:hypothetical protein
VTKGVGGAFRGQSSEAAPRIVVTAGKVFRGLAVHPQGWSPEARGVLAGLVVLQKSAGGVWEQV